MGTTLSSLNRKKRPGFYNNISGLPQTYRSDSGGVVNSSVVPIIKHINQVLNFAVDPTYGTDWLPQTVGHGIGKVYYVFARWRLQGDTSWTMCPQPNYDSASSNLPPRFWFDNISPSSITFGYFDYTQLTLKDVNIEVDLYFVNIPFNV